MFVSHCLSVTVLCLDSSVCVVFALSNIVLVLFKIINSSLNVARCSCQNLNSTSNALIVGGNSIIDSC